MELIIANTFLLVLLFAVSFFLGLYVLMLSPAETTHRLFFAAIITLDIVYIFLILLQCFGDQDILWLIYKLGTVLMFIFLHLVFMFLIYLTRSFGLLKLSRIFLFICFLFSVVTLNSDQYIIFTKINHMLVVEGILPSIEYWINPIYYSANIIMYAFILITSFFKTDSYREKRQYKILFVTLVVSIALLIICIQIQMNLYDYHFPIPPMPPLMFIFVAGCWYGIYRYKMFSVASDLVYSDIISNIDEMILILDRTFKIVIANINTGNLLNYKKLDGKYYHDIVIKDDKIEKEINSLFKNEIKSFSAKLYFKNSSGNSIIAEARFSTIKDKFNDILGILIIAKELKEITRFKSIYRITGREVEIIEYIIMGYTNVEIAEKLHLSSNTVKRHISNIYNKLGIYSKIQLYSLLRDFNIIPEKKSEKTLINFN